MNLSARSIKILAFVLTVVSGLLALVTSGAVTLDVNVKEPVEVVEEAPVEAEAPVEPAAPALAEPIAVPAETQVVDEASDAPAADVAVEASGG